LANRTDKTAFLRYLQCGKNPLEFSWEAAKECHKHSISDNAKRGHKSFITRVGVEEVSRLKSNAAKKGISTRIRKLASTGMSDDEAKRISYSKACVKKGIKIANEFGIDISALSESEISKLSGLKKKKTFSSLSDEDKYEHVLNWKRSVLKNKNVIAEIQKENPSFMLTDFPDEMVERWYKEYCSIKSTNKIKSGLIKGYGLGGCYLSTKTGKTYYYRSSYELRFLMFLDDCDKILGYDVEPFHLKLNSGKRYVPDVVAQTVTGYQVIFEIKPEFKIDDFMVSKGNEIMNRYDNFYLIPCKMIDNLEKLNEFISRICKN
jgi:hypothetical protein